MDIKLPRCPNGTRRNKKTGICEKNVGVRISVSPSPPQVLAPSQVLAPPQVLAPEQVLAHISVQKKRCPKGTRRNKKTGNCDPIIQRERIEVRTPSPVAAPLSVAEPSSSKKLRAAKTLKNFMLQKKHKIRAEFLKNICSDSGVCIAFGKESDKIKKFFNNFTNFDYVVSRRRVGAPSVNGFVYEIEYKHQNYFAHAILKSSSKADADNLMYEYNVGQSVNILNKHFPCFVETYGVYRYNSNIEWINSKNNNNVKKLQNILIQYPTTNYKDSCLYSKHLCILIQHIKNAQTLYEINKNLTFRENDSLYCLYQIYYSLSMLSDDFTHYDLHSNNVLLYQPVSNKYIQYHYHLPNGTVVSFKSKYIVKIIDYGRSHVNDSMADYNKICGIKECDPCGAYKGYAWLSPKPDDYFINSSLLNKSHDLRLLNSIKNYYASNGAHDFELRLKSIIDKVVYKNEFGSKSIQKNGYPKKINNVMDAEQFLRDMVLDPVEIQKNTEYHDLLFTKLGDLHVYGLSREMEYISA